MKYPDAEIHNHKGIKCYFHAGESAIQFWMDADNSNDASQTIELGSLSVPSGYNPCHFLLVCNAWIEAVLASQSEKFNPEELEEIFE